LPCTERGWILSQRQVTLRLESPGMKTLGFRVSFTAALLSALLILSGMPGGHTRDE